MPIDFVILKHEGSSRETCIVMDADTAEFLGEYERPDGRRINSQRKIQKQLQQRREIRNISSPLDARCNEDLDAILGLHHFYPTQVLQRGTELLPKIDISRRAKDLFMSLVHQTLHAENYAVVSNDTIKALCGDSSGNYGLYLKQLEGAGLMRIIKISKTHKLLVLNPLYAFRGSEYVQALAVQRWYSPYKHSRGTAGILVGNYENEVLQAA